MKKIKLIQTINQIDVFPNMPVTTVDFLDRLTGKAIVLDSDSKIALVGSSLNNIYTLPGGGIDQGETIEEGIIREITEEIGCNAKIDYMLGIIDDYRNRDKAHCINHCAVAKVVGQKGIPKLTEEEKKNGLHVKWVILEEALDILNKEKVSVLRGEINFYNTAYNIIRDDIFLAEFSKINSKN